MSLYSALQKRGYIYQNTDESTVACLLNQKIPLTFYMGIDPTADSLHIGHFFALMMFRYLQEAGHRGILVIGGATALVGDPSGKKAMRRMLNHEEVAKNMLEVEKLSKRFVNTTGNNPAIILNNADWIGSRTYIDFLREVGVHFNINTMLHSDAYAKRLEEGGLTFLEMGYMLMQAYDFEYLNQKYNCILQIGGSDQWGNIIAGISLHRKIHSHSNSIPIYGLTCPLLTTKDGTKMGKTEAGTLWVAREKTTVFEFYQYFYNTADENIEMLLKLFTRIPIQEINTLTATDIREAKRVMVYEITKLVHGKIEADTVVETVKSLFGTSTTYQYAPSITMRKEQLSQPIDILSFLVAVGMVPSKSEARRLVTQGGVALNGIKVTAPERAIGTSDVKDGTIWLKKGKKAFLKVHIQ